MDPAHHDGADAPGLAAPARLTPESATPPGMVALQGEQEREHRDSAEAAAERKADATLAAEFALAGIELVRLADGKWLASRWGLFKQLGSADEARTWLARVGRLA